MKKIAFILSLLIFSGGLTSTLAHSVEFGQDATGDTNAVKVGQGSGFLFSERIVLTVGHVIERTGGIAYWEREGVIYSPGIVTVYGQKTYRVKKVIMSANYLAPDYGLQ